MKSTAEIRFTATFAICSAELPDAKWKKLTGDYSEGLNWGTDHDDAIRYWAEEEITSAMNNLIESKVPASIEMPHCSGGDRTEEFSVEIIDSDLEGIDLTNSL